MLKSKYLVLFWSSTATCSPFAHGLLHSSEFAVANSNAVAGLRSDQVVPGFIGV